MRIAISITSFLLLTFGCSESNKKSKSTATPAENIQYISNVIKQNIKLPSEIIGAQYLEEQIGDGNLGPSDFQFYLRITVKKEDIMKWVSGLKKPYNHTSNYSQPKTNTTWWISQNNFKGLELYETKTYFNRVNGWICIDKDKGQIFVYTFTM